MNNNNFMPKPDSSIWNELSWHPSNDQMYQFQLFQDFLININSQLNLTRLLEGNDFWIAQVFDSLWPFKEELKHPELSRELIDVGSGCGFPGLALAIALPLSKVTLVEAVAKKQQAIQSIANLLKINSRVEILNERIETTGQNPKYRGKFDIAMARAVGIDSVVAEYLVPLIKDSGEAVLFKGKWSLSDKETLESTLKILNSKINLIESIQLPASKGIRHQIRINLITKCPKKYPRAIGIPKKRPLCTPN